VAKLRLSIFSNYGTVPLQIAVQRGFFEELDLSVDIEAAAPTVAMPDLKVFMGSASYRLPFVVAPSITTFDDLRGCIIAVDALSTGFAFLLREMLEINGLASDSYEFKSFGAPKERWHAVRTGAAAGALLNAHFEAIAHQVNCKTLHSNPDPWDNYAGNTFCAGPQFLNDGPVDDFITALLRAVAFTKDPENTDTVAAALGEHIGNLDSAAQIEIARSLQGAGSILLDKLPVSHHGVAEVLRLREKYTDTRLGLTPEDLCDRRVTFAP